MEVQCHSEKHGGNSLWTWLEPRTQFGAGDSESGVAAGTTQEVYIGCERRRPRADRNDDLKIDKKKLFQKSLRKNREERGGKAEVDMADGTHWGVNDSWK